MEKHLQSLLWPLENLVAPFGLPEEASPLLLVLHQKLQKQNPFVSH